MKKQLLCLSLAAMMSIGITSVTALADNTSATDTAPRTMYRLYNPNSGEHFYTASEEEKANLIPRGWRDEGTGWIAPTKSDTPVYRLYNPNEGDHHYTMSKKERDICVKAGWNYEGIGWYSADSDMERLKLYREFNPNERVGTHNYTTSIKEHKHLVSIGWRDEGTAWYGLMTNDNAPVFENFASDETVYLAGSESDITFTVKGTNIRNAVMLTEDGTEIAEMHDDGENGDAAAGDDIYTYILSTTKTSTTTVEYSAASGSKNSDSIEIRFFSRGSDDFRQEIQDSRNHIAEIEAEYQDENGYVPEDKVPDVLASVKAYLDELSDAGTVASYEVNDTNIIIQFSNGLLMAYEPTVDGVDSISSSTSMSVRTYQPAFTENNDRIGESLNAEVDNAATRVDASFSNYTFDGNYDDGNVTLSRVRNLSSNSVVLWHGHGGYSKSKHSYILTGEAFDWNAWWWDPVYCLDNMRGLTLESGSGNVCFTSKYVDKYCGDLTNTMIYMACCESGRDSVLADAFLGKGASAYVGNSHTVYTMYNIQMLNRTVTAMTQLNSSTNNYNTLKEALDNAKSQLGADDVAWYRNENDKEPENHPAAVPTIFGGTNAENYRFADAAAGTLSGKVSSADDRNLAIEGAHINIFKGTALQQTVTSNASGNYSVNLPTGDYRLEITADGYLQFTAYAAVTENENTYLETFLMVEGSEGENGVAAGKITNAVTGAGVGGVTLQVRSGWNNSTEGDVLATVSTADSGDYSVELPLGNYTLIASKEGFVSTQINIVVSRTTATLTQNGSISPIGTGDSYRIVLTWGENPRDLDSHVQGKLSNGSSFHVYYSNKSARDGDTEVCNLDVDDTSSYGPETITLNTTSDAPYYYYIYRYAGSGTVAASGAKITVYRGETQVAVYNVPTDLGDSDYWNVFAVVNGEIVTRNTITTSAETTYAG